MVSKLVVVSLITAIRSVTAQWACGGNSYTPGSINFTQECYDAAQSCIQQFGADVSLEYCHDPAGNLYMQQQPYNGNNNDYLNAFDDILDFCLIDGWTTGTWDDDYDGQWYWMAAESGCYSSTGSVATTGPGFCVQNRDDTTINGCYPQPIYNSGPLQVLYTAQTANGFTTSGRGWNSWGVEATPATTPSWTGLNQANVISQCSVMASEPFQKMGFTVCSLDAGWAGAADEYGRTLYNNATFDLPALAEYLHSVGLELGVYGIPGVPCSAANDTIYGTDILIADVLNGNNDGLGTCDFDFSKDGVQQYHDSLIDLWASWGVDMIKLDFVTPGSPWNGANLVCDNSPAVIAFHNAIKNSGRQIRLDLSWKLCRNETYLPIWSEYAESIRTDQDINNYGGITFVIWQEVQRAIDNYRQYISLQKQRNVPITLYPDMDNLFVANPENVTGVSDIQRITMMNHWLGAAANLILGSDLTAIDDLGMQLLTSQQTIDAANFFAQYPMQPRNPGTGNNLAQQLQAWIAGPTNNNEGYVLIVNYGPDQGAGGFGTSLTGVQNVTVSLEDLGIAGKKWKFQDVWAGNSTTVSTSYSAFLNESESQLLYFKA